MLAGIVKRDPPKPAEEILLEKRSLTKFQQLQSQRFAEVREQILSDLEQMRQIEQTLGEQVLAIVEAPHRPAESRAGTQIVKLALPRARRSDAKAEDAHRSATATPTPRAPDGTARATIG